MPDIRGTQAWRKLSKRVIAEEPYCWLRLPGCTLISTTADHVLTVESHPDMALVRENCHGACAKCNYSRSGKELALIASQRNSVRFFD